MSLENKGFVHRKNQADGGRVVSAYHNAAGNTLENAINHFALIEVATMGSAKEHAAVGFVGDLWRRREVFQAALDDGDRTRWGCAEPNCATTGKSEDCFHGDWLEQIFAVFGAEFNGNPISLYRCPPKVTPHHETSKPMADGRKQFTPSGVSR